MPIVRLNFKCPDVVYNAINDHTQEFEHEKREQIEETLSKFIKHGEYVTIEIDTDKQTASVIPVK